MRNYWIRTASVVMAVLMLVSPLTTLTYAEDTPDILIRNTIDMQALTAGEATEL